MTHQIFLKRVVIDFEDADVPAWLFNSYSSLGIGWDTADVEYIDNLYQQTFNVKVLYAVSKSPTGAIAGIEFPSEEEATLFMLRWG